MHIGGYRRTHCNGYVFMKLGQCVTSCSQPRFGDCFEGLAECISSQLIHVSLSAMRVDGCPSTHVAMKIHPRRSARRAHANYGARKQHLNPRRSARRAHANYDAREPEASPPMFCVAALDFLSHVSRDGGIPPTRRELFAHAFSHWALLRSRNLLYNAQCSSNGGGGTRRELFQRASSHWELLRSRDLLYNAQCSSKGRLAHG